MPILNPKRNIWEETTYQLIAAYSLLVLAVALDLITDLDHHFTPGVGLIVGFAIGIGVGLIGLLTGSLYYHYRRSSLENHGKI